MLATFFLQNEFEMPTKRVFFMSPNFPGRRHRHPDGWSPSMIEFFKDASEFNSDVGNIHVCVCEACHVSIRLDLQPVA